MSTTPIRRPRRDEGYALLTVLVGMSVLVLILTTALTYSTQSLRTVGKARDWNQALLAADAGVADFLARLNARDSYWQTVDCTNPALKGPISACGWNAGTPVGWASVPGGGGAQFHYEVNTTSTPTNGTIALTVTGRDDGETRTIQLRLRRGGFGEFLYYSVYETIDPANETYFGVGHPTAGPRCSQYYWNGRSSWINNPCLDPSFITGDSMGGPMHSNDTILMTGRPVFNGTVTTSLPACKDATNASACYRSGGGGTNPVFNKGIAYRPEITLPDSIGDLRQHVASTATNPGCLFTGPTRIRLSSSSGSVSTMRVWSPWTKAPLNPGCGTPPLDGDTLTIPNNNIIIVQAVPGSQTRDALNNTVPTGSCGGGWIGDGFPLAGTSTTGDFNQTLGESDCRYGTLYVEGSLKGRLTMAADNNVVVTGDLTYAGGTTGTDALGLIANNSVKVYHPARCTDYSSSTKKCSNGTNINRPNGSTWSNPRIYASILTLQHSFAVQQHNLGNPLGDLNVFGTLAQRYRGAVGVNSGGSITAGYLKKYSYDTRMRYAPPPFFLDPVRSAWGVKTYGEVAPRYGS